MNSRTYAILALSASFVFAGCNKKADNTVNYTSAVNTYYNTHPACLYAQPKQFPVQVKTADTTETQPLDALVDQGLLVRTTAEKKKLLVLSEQVTNYDLSEKGRSAWTADPNQPGFGNFCYGHRKVSAIDSTTPATDQPGATTQIVYHYNLVDTANWATAAETQTAYPQVSADFSGPQTGQATLTDTANGWVVTSAPGAAGAVNTTHPATPADGKIVQ